MLCHLATDVLSSVVQLAVRSIAGTGCELVETHAPLAWGLHDVLFLEEVQFRYKGSPLMTAPPGTLLTQALYSRESRSYHIAEPYQLVVFDPRSVALRADFHAAATACSYQAAQRSAGYAHLRSAIDCLGGAPQQGLFASWVRTHESTESSPWPSTVFIPGWYAGLAVAWGWADSKPAKVVASSIPEPRFDVVDAPADPFLLTTSWLAPSDRIALRATAPGCAIHQLPQVQVRVGVLAGASLPFHYAGYRCDDEAGVGLGCRPSLAGLFSYVCSAFDLDSLLFLTELVSDAGRTIRVVALGRTYHVHVTYGSHLAYVSKAISSDTFQLTAFVTALRATEALAFVLVAAITDQGSESLKRVTDYHLCKLAIAAGKWTGTSRTPQASPRPTPVLSDRATARRLHHVLTPRDGDCLYHSLTHVFAAFRGWSIPDVILCRETRGQVLSCLLWCAP